MRAIAALVSSRTISRSSVAVSVGIDQLPHGSRGDGRPRCRDEQEAGVLPQIAAGDRTDADRGTVELEIHLGTPGQADAIPEHARDDQSPCLVDGCSHGTNTTIWVAEPLAAPAPTRGRAAAPSRTPTILGGVRRPVII